MFGRDQHGLVGQHVARRARTRAVRERVQAQSSRRSGARQLAEERPREAFRHAQTSPSGELDRWC